MRQLGGALRVAAIGAGMLLWLVALGLAWSLGDLEYGAGAVPVLVAEFPKVAGIAIIVTTMMGGALISWAARR